MKRQMKKLSKQTYPSLRMRRLRNNSGIRKLISETKLTVDNLVQPIFVTEGKNKAEKISSLPGIYRYSEDNLLREVKKLKSLGIIAVALFPNISKNNKSESANEAFNNDGLIQRCIRKIKDKFPDFIVISDVALDPYTSHGQDGIIDSTGYIINDVTNDVLLKQALSHAEAGSDIVAPSDMMDGRIKIIRKGLEKENFYNTKILSYSAKYASSYYGPFRDAVGSKSFLKGDKKTYQMDYKNSDEALREVALDIKEGADMVMVKPGMPYLDIIQKVKENFKIPVLAYQVSGEYSLIKSGINNKLINEEAIIESLMCFKRAGASAIVSYFALDIAKKIKS